MIREPALAPPKGYHPTIPLGVKLQAALASLGLTTADVEWHHDPPLALRVWDPIAGDTVPAANDPAHIVMLLTEAHAVRTNGPKTKAVAQGDKTAIARTRRLAKGHEAFRATVLAKGEPKPASEAPRAKSKRTIRSRGFEKRRSP